MPQVVLYKDNPEILEKPSEPVTKFDRKLTNLVNSMYSVINKRGVGLAAVQLGIHKQVIVTLNPQHGMRRVFINASILDRSAEEVEEAEGCLSAPGQTVLIKRPKWVRVAYQNVTGQLHEILLEGYDARIFCHEYDHTIGVMCTKKK